MSKRNFRGEGPNAVRRVASQSWQSHDLAMEEEEPALQRREPTLFYVVRRPIISEKELAELHEEAQAKLDAQRAIKLMLRMMVDEQGDTFENYQRNADEIRGVFERLGYSFKDALSFVHVALRETGVVLTKRRHVEIMLALIPREYSEDDVLGSTQSKVVPQLHLLPDFNASLELDEDPVFVGELTGTRVVNRKLSKLGDEVERNWMAAITYATDNQDILASSELWQSLAVELPEAAPAEESYFHPIDETDLEVDSEEAVERYCQECLQRARMCRA